MMESNFEMELQVVGDNVVSLDEQRKLRAAAQEPAETEVESIAEPKCENGVCSLSWSPKKKAA